MGDYLADPRSYDPEASFRHHVAAFMGPEAATLGETLSRWFTTEWFAHPGSGCVASENNLLPLIGDPAPDRKQCIAGIRATLGPLQDFKDRFQRTLMPPQVAGHLAPYASLLADYARAMVAYCDAAVQPAEAGTETAQVLLAQVDRPETECFRLPLSLIQYAKALVQQGSTPAAQKETLCA